jgi:hypothetical protein
MAKFTFADRYSEAGLEPSSEKINSRYEPVKRIIEDITDAQLIDLVLFYYNFPSVNLDWFRDEFAQEDSGFSLVNNKREAHILASLVLSGLIDEENSKAILAVISAGVKGARTPSQSVWLQSAAEESFLRLSVKDRELAVTQTKIAPPGPTKLGTEITELGQTNTWEALINILGKMREEYRVSAISSAKQITGILEAFERRTLIMQEESQMLWWLTGGYSRTFERSFSTFGPMQAAVAGAVDLGTLTTYTQLGPIAVPAMLERVISASKKLKKQPSNIASAIDSFTVDELKMLDVPNHLPPELAPVSYAIDSARTVGAGLWHTLFQTKTGLDANAEFSPLALGEQIYREHLLGKLL